MKTNERMGKMVNLVCKAVALAMGVAVVALGALKGATVDTQTTLLGIGLFTLALAALNKESL